MELLLKMVFVKYVIFHVLLVSDLLAIVYPALMDKFFIMEDVGQDVLQL